MNLLAKFETVEIRSDDRISQADRTFCEAHQAAYENARTALLELEFFWNDIQKQQENLLEPAGTSPDTYLTGLNLPNTAIHKQIQRLHTLFISYLVSYFSRTYHFSIQASDVEENLLPRKPTDRWEDNYPEQVTEYTRELENLTLRYTDILEQIFLQMGGRAFYEQALHELKEKCHQAAWNSGNGRPRFERKKSVLQFSQYACSFRSWCSSESWELSDGIKNILRGIAHFETGSFDTTPDSLSRVIGSYTIDSSQWEFPDCKKIHSLRMFKNGRVDLKFTSETNALQFVDEYLKTIY